MGAQGPLTSAVLMRGQDFIYDVYDEPEKAKRFLALLTDSIVGFHHFTNKVLQILQTKNYTLKSKNYMMKLIIVKCILIIVNSIY